MTRLITPAVLQRSAVKDRGGLKYIDGLVNHAFAEAYQGHRGLRMTKSLDGAVVVYTDTRHKWQACMTAEEALHFDGRM